MRGFLWLTLAAVLVLLPRLHSAPVVSEFLADNETGIADEDGARGDWIEVLNPDASAVILTNWRLSDNPAEPAKWLFPARTLAVGERLVIWANGKNRRPATGPLHTNFSINKSGGSLFLSRPDGVVASSYSNYPPQLPDFSYGQTGPKLLAIGAPARWRVLDQDLPGWMQPAYPDQSWTSATSGVGYDLRTAGALYPSLLGGGSCDLAGRLFFGRDAGDQFSSVAVRIPFQVADPSAIAALTLRMRYDDGFVVWINGAPAIQVNVPTSPAWNSLASSSRDATAWTTHDLTASLGDLRAGINVLAIQGVNRVLTSNDLLVLPELDAAYAPSALPAGYLPKPTPGQPNGSAVAGKVSAPAFSVPAGWQTTAVNVVAAGSTPGAVLHFTTDGTEPTTGSPVLAGSLSLTTTTTLRVLAVKPGWAPSSTATRTWLFPAAVLAQSTQPPGFPATWGKAWDSAAAALSTTTSVAADYEMDPSVLTNPGTHAAATTSLQSLPAISLVLPTAEFLADEGLYGNRRVEGGGESEIPVSVEIIEPAGGAALQVNAGLRMHGGNARLTHPKKPLRLYFRKSYGAGKLRYPLFGNAGPDFFDQLVLRPGGHDGWASPFGAGAAMPPFHATYLRDAFVRRTEAALGLPAPRGRYVQVFINGLYWGVYEAVERLSASYFAQRLGGTEDEWDVVHHAENRAFEATVLDGAMGDWQALTTLAHGPATDLAVAEMGRRLELDSFCDHLIVRMWAGDYDWLQPILLDGLNVGSFSNKNWYAAARRRGPLPGLFQLVSWDAEFTMGQHLMSRLDPAGLTFPPQRQAAFDFTGIGPVTFSEAGTSYTVQTPGGLYAWLRGNAGFRRRFGDRLQRAFFQGGALSAPVATARLAALKAELSAPMLGESLRWGDVNGAKFTREGHWLPEVDWLRDEFINGNPTRTARVLDQFFNRNLFPSVDPIVWSQHGGDLAAGSTIHLSSAGGAVYVTRDGSDPLLPDVETSTPLVTSLSAAQWLVPTVANGGAELTDSWRAPGPLENAETWTPGMASIGYEIPGDPTNPCQLPARVDGRYAPFFKTNVAAMREVNASIFLRIPFTLTAGQIAGFNGLSLSVRFDDGFRAWINGVEVAARHAPASAAWDSAATRGQQDDWAVSPWWHDVSAALPALRPGENILSFQVMNGEVDSLDLLLAPTLAGHVVTPGGQLRSGAELVTGPLRIETSQTISARVRTVGNEWGPLDQAHFNTPLLTYAAWRDLWWPVPGPSSLEGADPDSDGLANFLEFALGSNPVQASPQALPGIGPFPDPTHWGVRYAALPQRSGIAVTPEISTDLQHWTPANLTGVAPDTWNLARPAGGKAWFRLRVESVP
jgi:CotH kinase protein/Lamin Tail Domain/Chitobiase/beta-hexosaminidase C-terminal domain